MVWIDKSLNIATGKVVRLTVPAFLSDTPLCGESL